jgi:hypothetical protein
MLDDATHGPPYAIDSLTLFLLKLVRLLQKTTFYEKAIIVIRARTKESSGKFDKGLNMSRGIYEERLRGGQNVFL